MAMVKKAADRLEDPADEAICALMARIDAKAPKTPKERLIEWAKDLHFPDVNVMPATTSLGRLVSEVAFDEKFRRGQRKPKRDLARRKSRARTVVGKETLSVRMEIIDGVPCKPDGGLWQLLVRKMVAIEKMQRCSAVAHAFEQMPAAMQQLVRISYYECAHYMDIPRQEEPAALMLGMSLRTYQRRHAEMLQWVGDFLGMPMDREGEAEAA